MMHNTSRNCPPNVIWGSSLKRERLVELHESQWLVSCYVDDALTAEQQRPKTEMMRTYVHLFTLEKYVMDDLLAPPAFILILSPKARRFRLQLTALHSPANQE